MSERPRPPKPDTDPQEPLSMEAAAHIAASFLAVIWGSGEDDEFGVIKYYPVNDAEHGSGWWFEMYSGNRKGDLTVFSAETIVTGNVGPDNRIT